MQKNLRVRIQHQLLGGRGLVTLLLDEEDKPYIAYQSSNDPKAVLIDQHQTDYNIAISTKHIECLTSKFQMNPDKVYPASELPVGITNWLQTLR